MLSTVSSGSEQMNTNREEYELNDKDLTFDFEEWAALFKADPDAFEQRRLKWSELIVKSAPSTYQRRLFGLLFQINMEKRRSKNSMDSCIRLSKLMWNKFDDLRTELRAIKRIPVEPGLSPSTRKSRLDEPGDVLTFPCRTLESAKF